MTIEDYNEEVWGEILTFAKATACLVPHNENDSPSSSFLGLPQFDSNFCSLFFFGSFFREMTSKKLGLFSLNIIVLVL